MSRPRIAAVTIGQTPRADLIEPLRTLADDRIEIVEVGALDGLTADRLPSRDGAAYPLTTRLQDGTQVTLDEADLAPLVQAAIDRADELGAHATLLLCAGGFLETTARAALVRPFDAAAARLRDIGSDRIAVLVPFEGQVEPSRRKWIAAGFDVVVIVGDPAKADMTDTATCDAIVLDYVGHAARDVEAIRARVRAPVVDLGECGAAAAIAALSGMLVEPSPAAP